MNLPDMEVSESPSAVKWWYEWEAWAIVLLAAAIYLPRIGEVPLRGEETRRAGIAIEMIQSGDWLVPQMQGSPVYFRPPLQNWAIGLAGLLRGDVDPIAIRWPSVVSVILLGLLIYAYTRTCVGRLGALAAGVAFITMGQVLELGRLGETDPLLAFLLGGSLLIWHYGRMRGWSPVWFWIAGYLLAGLATLTKGAQGPAYFGAAIGVFLLWTGRWREAFRWSHLAGILVFVAVLGLWHVPYYYALGWEGLRRIYWDDLGVRFGGSQWIAVRHLASYPLEVLGCLLPWSVLLIAYLDRGFRNSLKTVREQVLFVACSIAVTFPSCWFATHARGRYFMALYPCFAVLIGLVVQHCCEAAPTQRWRALWSWFLTTLSLLILGGGVSLAVMASIRQDALGQPVWFVVVYLVASMALAAATWWSSRSNDMARAALGVLSVAAFLGLTSTGAMTNYMIYASEPNAASVADLKRRLPPNVRLVSLGRIDHLFAYYYRDPIGLLPRTAEAEQAIAPGDYFCSGDENTPAMEVSFPYQMIAEVPCDRWRANRGKRAVLVGRRLPAGDEQRTTCRLTPTSSFDQDHESTK